MELKELIPGNRYLNKFGSEFELLAHGKIRDDEAVAEYPDKCHGLSIITQDFGPFRPVPKKLTAVVAMVKHEGIAGLRFFTSMRGFHAYWACLEIGLEIIGVSEIEICEGEFAEGWEP